MDVTRGRKRKRKRDRMDSESIGPPSPRAVENDDDHEMETVGIIDGTMGRKVIALPASSLSATSTGGNSREIEALTNSDSKSAVYCNHGAKEEPKNTDGWQNGVIHPTEEEEEKEEIDSDLAPEIPSLRSDVKKETAEYEVQKEFEALFFNEDEARVTVEDGGLLRVIFERKTISSAPLPLSYFSPLRTPSSR